MKTGRNVKDKFASFLRSITLGVAAYFALVQASSAAPKYEFLRPSLSDENSFSMILVGDLQRYSMDIQQQPMLNIMLAWISKSIESINIKAAFFAGDFVEYNDWTPKKKSYTVNASSQEQWNFISNSFKILDGKIPYICATGNHDYGIKCFENRQTSFSKVFTPERNLKNKAALIATHPNTFGQNTLENACYEIDCGDKWEKIIVFAFEYYPRKEVLQWAHNLAKTNFSDKRIFLLVHDYIYPNGEFTKGDNYGYVNVKVPDGGNRVWEDFVKITPNVVFVMCGHTYSGPHVEDCSGLRIDVNNAGKKVHAMLFAPHGVNYSGYGVDAWLRILEFMPDGKTVKASTYSPMLNQSHLTYKMAWSKTPKTEFEIVLDK